MAERNRISSVHRTNYSKNRRGQPLQITCQVEPKTMSHRHGLKWKIGLIIPWIYLNIWEKGRAEEICINISCQNAYFRTKHKAVCVSVVGGTHHSSPAVVDCCSDGVRAFDLSAVPMRRCHTFRGEVRGNRHKTQWQCILDTCTNLGKAERSACDISPKSIPLYINNRSHCRGDIYSNAEWKSVFFKTGTWFKVIPLDQSCVCSLVRNTTP